MITLERMRELRKELDLVQEQLAKITKKKKPSTADSFAILRLSRRVSEIESELKGSK